MHKGSCLCGNIRYHIKSEPGDFGYCHCKSCQKASGSSHAANAGVEKKDVEFFDPRGFLKEYESSPGKFRVFCSNCGSPLYAYLTQSPEIIRVRLGSLDTPFRNRAKAHTFVKEKAAWEVIQDSLPQFDEWAPAEVLRQKGSKQPI